MAAHQLNVCYKSCETKYGNSLQQTKKNITEYEQSHKNGYSNEEIETYNKLQQNLDGIMTDYNKCRTDCKKQTAGSSCSKRYIVLKIKQKDDKHVVHTVVVAILAGIVSSKIAIIIFYTFVL
jgi:hypothetical protein